MFAIKHDKRKLSCQTNQRKTVNAREDYESTIDIVFVYEFSHILITTSDGDIGFVISEIKVSILNDHVLRLNIIGARFHRNEKIVLEILEML